MIRRSHIFFLIQRSPYTLLFLSGIERLKVIQKGKHVALFEEEFASFLEWHVEEKLTER